MATSAPITDVDIPECPVCQDEYTDPKILPCNHIVCRKCVLSWIEKEGGAGSCPVCRAQILPSPNSDLPGQGKGQNKVGQGKSKVGQGQSNLAGRGQRKVGQGQGNLAAVVDALPTDLALATFVESSQVLKGHRGCAVCEESGVVATTYCLQCEFHLCQACNKTHKKYPANREHQVEVLASLTREKVASSRRFMCQVHRDKPAEIYCSAHKELVCVLCILTTHEQCPGKKSVQDVAKSERESLAKRASALREKEAALTKQINQIKQKFKARHQLVKNTFDYLQQELEKRRQELTQKVKAAEDYISKNSLALLEQRRSAVMSQASSIEHHVASSPDYALLMMMKDLTSRLDDVETTLQTAIEIVCGGELTFETGALPRLNLLKIAIQTLGSVGSVAEVKATMKPQLVNEKATYVQGFSTPNQSPPSEDVPNESESEPEQEYDDDYEHDLDDNTFSTKGKRKRSSRRANARRQ